MDKHRRVALFTMISLILMTGLASAQTWVAEGPGPIVNGQVENVGSNNEVVGAIQAIAPHPTNADILLAGAVNGGIWRTTNATAVSPQWQNMTPQTVPPFIDSLSIRDLAFDVTDSEHQIVWAAIGGSSSFEPEKLTASSPWLGLMRSTNGGSSWNPVSGGGTLFDRNVVNVLPRGTTIVVGVERSVAEVHGNDCLASGIFRSIDNGANFTKISGLTGSGLPNGGVDALVGHPDPRASRFMLASVTGAGTNDCSAASVGIYRSDDDGATWTKISSPEMDALIETSNDTNVKISVGNTQNGTGQFMFGEYYVGIVPGSTKKLGGVFYSFDLTNWTAMDLPSTDGEGINPGGQGNLHFSLVADPNLSGVVYVGGDRQTNNAQFGSPNSIGAEDFTGRLFRGNAFAAPGFQWTPLTHVGTASNSAPHADSRDMEFDAAGTLLESDDGGIYKRTSPTNNAGDWFSVNGDIQTTELHSLAYDSVSDTIISAAMDTGVQVQIMPGGTPGSETWGQGTAGPPFNLLAGDGGGVAVDNNWRADPAPCLTPVTGDFSVRYQSSQALIGFSRLVFDDQNQLQCKKSLANLVSSNSNPLGFIDPLFFTPLEANAIAGKQLVIGGRNGIFESTDGGDTVTLIGANLWPRNVTGRELGGNPFAYGALGNPGILYVAACNNVGEECGLYARSTSGQPLTKLVNFPGTNVRSVVIDQSNPALVVAVADGNVHYSPNSGANWATVSAIPDVNGEAPFPISLEFLNRPSGDDAIVVGTRQHGVFIAELQQSNGFGFGPWAQFGDSGLPRAPVFALDYSQMRKKLVAGLLGRGAYSLTEAQADLSVSITLDTPGPYSTGQMVQYTIVVTNLGPNPATGVTISKVATNQATTSVSSTPQGGCESMDNFTPCVLGTLGPSAIETITVTQRIQLPGVFGTVASVSARQLDPVSANNNDGTGNDGTASFNPVVTNTGDSGPGSLRQAIIDASPGGTVTFAGAIGSSILLESQIIVNKNITIDASARPNGITIEPANATRILSIANGVTVTLESLTLANGDATAGSNNDQFGGAIFNGGSLTLLNSSLVGNTARLGAGAIWNQATGTLTLINSTLSGNRSVGLSNGGAILNNQGSVSVIHSTISDNSATNFGGGIDNSGGTVLIDNSIVAGNRCAPCFSLGDPGADKPDDIGNRDEGNVFKEGANLIGNNTTVSSVFSDADPLVGTPGNPLPPVLGLLANNGGPTPTMAPLPSTPTAIDNAIENLNSQGTDQRGVTRPFGQSDIGAVEIAGNSADLTVTKTLDTPPPYAVGQTIQFTIVVSALGPDPATNVSVIDSPVNLTLDTVSSTGSCSELPCLITPGIPAGGSETLTVTATIDDATEFSNTVVVGGNDRDPDPSNNTSTAILILIFKDGFEN